MKQTFLLAIAIASLSLSSCGGNKETKETTSKKVEITVEKDSYKPAEKAALIVLKAYADEDLETLKSYASGSTKMALDKSYFSENGNVASFKEKIDANWKGSFTDIRYYEDEVNFQHYYYAIATFYESPSGQITGVALKSEDKENWKMSGFGTKHIKKEEFEALSTEMPE
jgi:hypothetical protein